MHAHCLFETIYFFYVCIVYCCQNTCTMGHKMVLLHGPCLDPAYEGELGDCDGGGHGGCRRIVDATVGYLHCYACQTDACTGCMPPLGPWTKVATRHAQVCPHGACLSAVHSQAALIHSSVRNAQHRVSQGASSPRSCHAATLYLNSSVNTEGRVRAHVPGLLCERGGGGSSRDIPRSRI